MKIQFSGESLILDNGFNDVLKDMDVINAKSNKKIDAKTTDKGFYVSVKGIPENITIIISQFNIFLYIFFSINKIPYF